MGNVHTVDVLHGIPGYGECIYMYSGPLCVACDTGLWEMYIQGTCVGGWGCVCVCVLHVT